MKFLIPLTLIAGALAAPAVDLETRQLLGNDVSNDFIQGGCKGVITIYARASTESGHIEASSFSIGISVGPELKTLLNCAYNNDVAFQGVEYPATLEDNFLPGFTIPAARDTMKRLLTDAATRCPNAKIAAGGYSQGTAVTARSIEQLPADIVFRIGVIVLFGYTQNQQLRGGIPGVQQSRIKVYCALGDPVCSGTLTITLSHFTYTGANTRDAAKFIQQQLG